MISSKGDTRARWSNLTRSAALERRFERHFGGAYGRCSLLIKVCRKLILAAVCLCPVVLTACRGPTYYQWGTPEMKPKGLNQDVIRIVISDDEVVASGTPVEAGTFQSEIRFERFRAETK